MWDLGQFQDIVIEQGEKTHELWILGFASAGQFHWLSLHYGIQIKTDFPVLKTLHGLSLANLWTVAPVLKKYWLSFRPFTHSHLWLSKNSLPQLPTPALWFTSPPTQTKLNNSNKKQTPTPTKSSFLHLILPPISLPSYNCLLFALIPLLMPWLQKAIQSGKHEVLQFHSIFHLLLNVVTSTSTPDCIHYPIYPWSDGRYYVRDTLQNKRYHPALITWFFKKRHNAKTRDC